MKGIHVSINYVDYKHDVMSCIGYINEFPRYLSKGGRLN
jgi:hypothetical protein